MASKWGGDDDHRVTVIGVGGAGSNAVAAMSRFASHGLRVLCADTDQRSLHGVDAPHRLQLGRQLTGGLGSGADIDTGRRAAEEAMPAILEALKGSGLCIIAAGLGGGTGTGAAPVIAAAARACGAVVIGIAIKPFGFEGKRRARNADRGAALFEEQADAMVTVCNEYLFRIAAPDMTMRDALAASNALVCESASGFARLVSDVALKRVGLADLRGLLAAGGKSVIGYGEHGEGADRALHAARSALCNPLLETTMRSAGRLLVTISGGEDLRLYEVDAAIAWLTDHVEPGADIVWGATTDATLGGRVRIGIAATRLVAASHGAEPAESPVSRSRRTVAAPRVPASVVAAGVVARPVVAAPVAAPPAMERVARVAPQPAPAAVAAPVAGRAPVRVQVPAPPPMEWAAAAARQPVPVEVAAAAPAAAEIAAPVPVEQPFARAAAGVLVLDGEYVVNDRVMRVRGRPPASLADRVYGVLKDGAQTLRRGATMHLAA
ncbi:MAG: cell division protein FtsZ [Pseudomonadota bacterium]